MMGKKKRVTIAEDWWGKESKNEKRGRRGLQWKTDGARMTRMRQKREEYWPKTIGLQ